jgi:hypothetical protein
LKGVAPLSAAHYILRVAIDSDAPFASGDRGLALNSVQGIRGRRIAMIRKELIRRSPLRILEKSTQGGVGKGNIGVIAARKGVGKTAALVHIATDQLFQDKHVIHVSFSDSADHIIAWYEDIFEEIARRNNLDCAMEVHDAIIKNRVIMNFQQDGIHVAEIQKSVSSLISNGNFSADTIIVDGYDFNRGSLEELRGFRRFAADQDLEIWFSATIRESPEAFDGSDIAPSLAPFVEELAIVICMQPRDNFIHLNLVKDHDQPMAPDLHLKLDPKILLIAEER